jgi:hypothetical protein
MSFEGKSSNEMLNVEDALAEANGRSDKQLDVNGAEIKAR